ncbi:hypothetical protein TKK_0003896 [Trichogramma kaykai]|uniref:PDZ domain-containing protein n=1 Tax=Trichogramma kaykai TaxID=54128 RepID=A0ABD2XP09_9HYME
MFKRLTRTRRHSADEIGGLHHVSGKNFSGDADFQPQRYRDKSDHHHHHHHRSREPSPASSSLRYGSNGSSTTTCPSPTPQSYLHSAKSRFARRSCGDAYSLLSCSDEDASSNSGESTCTTRSASQRDDEQQQQQPRREKERDYTLVTAVPAFIVEHVEPEKQKSGGLKDVWGLRRMGKKLDSFRRSGSRDSICGTIPERPDTNHNHIDGGGGGGTNNNNDYSSDNNNFNHNNHSLGRNNNKNNNHNNNHNNNQCNEKLRRSSSTEKKSGKRSASPFKSFFIRMGSTGMLNTSSSSKNHQQQQQSHQSQQQQQHRSRRSSQANCDSSGKTSSQTTGDKDGLFRSCSTSQLNTSPTYVKGDDPSEGIDLRMTSNKLSSLSPAQQQQQQQSDCLQSKTMSCDNLSGSRRRGSSCDEDDSLYGHEDDDDDEEVGRCQSTTPSFAPCDYNVPCRSDCMRKSSSCDGFKESGKKGSFPYAFLRSRLSVLPEESSSASSARNNYHGGSKEERLFKTASEEHFPALLKIEDSFADGTTTLGRRRPVKSNSSYNNHLEHRQQQYRDHRSSSGSRYRLGGDYARNSYAEEDNGGSSSGYFKVPSIMRNTGNSDGQRNSVSLPYQHQINDSAEPMSLDLSYDCQSERPASATATARTTATSINDNRRNSVAFGNSSHHVIATATNGVGEQRLSSHYVSSNESGYDSDGTRGESAASEVENHLKNGSAATSSSGGDGSSDTSSVIDAELDKPVRSSTPASDDQVCATTIKDDGGCGTGLDGLRWHRSSSGRMLPSINQANSGNKSESCSGGGGGILASAHRVRLQQDKTRFLTDIIEPATQTQAAATQRIRRTRLVQLRKSEPKESLGIRLAQQRLGESRHYVVVQLESDGIAHRDGRLRLGDEIVEVEGKDLRSLSDLDEVQEFLRSCEATTIHLKTVYEETVPQIFPLEEVKHRQQQDDAASMTTTTTTTTINKSNSTTRRSEYMESSRNLGGGGTLDRLDRAKILAHKRPDYLALNKIASSPSGVSITKTTTTTTTQQQQQQQPQQLVTTRHVVRFEKGAGKPSLGFSVVGGRDSPKGDMGIFVRRIFSGGQADVQKSLFQGDEILSINGKVLRGCTHQEVIEQFKGIREGIVELELARRHRHPKVPLKTAPY